MNKEKPRIASPLSFFSPFLLFGACRGGVIKGSVSSSNSYSATRNICGGDDRIACSGDGSAFSERVAWKEEEAMEAHNSRKVQWTSKGESSKA